ncbi:MAG: hypothetical protein NXH86_00055 [Flavobacteriaceae bacterium]|nr:hypothetical protein [Flavobacteriaceae bacterium]
MQLHCKIRKGPIEDLVYGTKSIPFQISRDDQMGQSGPSKIQDRKFPIHSNAPKGYGFTRARPNPNSSGKNQSIQERSYNRKNKSLLEQASTTAMQHETKYSWQVEQANVPCNGQVSN